MKKEVRPIDANATIEALRANFQQGSWYGCEDPLYQIAEDTIAEMPTIRLDPAHIDREAWNPCGACKDGNIKISIPEFRAMAICNQHMDHEAFTLTLQTRFCPVCGRPLTPEAWAELEKRLREIS